MIFDLRWVVSPRTSTAPPVLQFRQGQSDWQTVPTVVLPLVEDTVRGDSKPPA